MPITTIAGKTILDGNFYISDETTVVEIFSPKIDYNYDDALVEIPIPVSSGGTQDLKDNDQEPYSRIIDLKRIKEGLAVQGHLEDETGETAKEKRNKLLDLAKVGRNLIAVWGTGADQTLWQAETDPKKGTGIFIRKMMFTETAGTYGNGPSVVLRKIDIQIQLVRGKDM